MADGNLVTGIEHDPSRCTYAVDLDAVSTVPILRIQDAAIVDNSCVNAGHGGIVQHQIARAIPTDEKFAFGRLNARILINNPVLHFRRHDTMLSPGRANRC